MAGSGRRCCDGGGRFYGPDGVILPMKQHPDQAGHCQLDDGLVAMPELQIFHRKRAQVSGAVRLGL